MYIKDGIVVVKNEFEGKLFLYDKNFRTKYQINYDMFDLLKYIYDNKDISLNLLKSEYEDIDDIINFLIDENIITSNVQNYTNNIKEISKINTARLFIECTDKCNLYCSHCYGNFSNRRNKEISYELIEKLIKKCCEIGLYEIDITGGEPFMHSKIFDIFKLLNNYSMITTLFSNLTMPNMDDLDLIYDYGIKTIVTSIESYDSEVHDKFRGKKGAFSKTCKAIRYLNDLGIEVKVNLVLGDHNIDEADKTIQFITNELNVQCCIDFTTPQGRASNKNYQLDKAVQIIRKYDSNILISQNCGIGKRMLFVSSDGNILLCPSIREKKYSFGEIKREYDLKKCFIAASNIFEGWNCDSHCSARKCDGGCRARALILHGDLYSKDDYYCKLYEVE